MTRKAPAWRSMARRDDDGPWVVNLGPHSPFVVDLAKAPPLTLADRYTATATGWPPAVRTLTVTERETGATARWARGDRLVLTVPGAMAEVEAARLLRDARAIVGIARTSSGGPPVGTGLTTAQIVAATVKLWDPDPQPDGTPPTQREVADDLGTDWEGRSIRRVASGLPGPGRPWSRVLRDSRIARRIVSG